jgi:hypothetical protein
MQVTLIQLEPCAVSLCALNLRFDFLDLKFEIFHGDTHGSVPWEWDMLLLQELFSLAKKYSLCNSIAR